jgi:gamma-glutamyltranspeptidase
VPSTQAGIAVLRTGGTAADAAVAVAATFGVTDPYVAGIGGGGYFLYYDAKRHQVFTIDGRETTPAADGQNMFINPATGQPYSFPTAVTSGLSVGVPGTLATWQRVLDRWGRFNLARDLQPAINVADQGFVVDATFRESRARTSRGSRSSRRRGICSCPAVGCPTSALFSATRTSRTRIGRSRTMARVRCTADRSAPTSWTPSTTCRSRRTRV